MISGIVDESDESDDAHGHNDDHASEPVKEEKENCHFHAGVEHCTGGSHSGAATCSKVDRDYNIPLRIGSIFIVLATSAISVFLPLLLRRFTKTSMSSIIFMIIKQFGTGVIIATAFVHLLTHAQMMFANECIGILQYEATASAIAMAGLFLAFAVDWSAHRFMTSRQETATASLNSSNSALEAGVESKDENNEHKNANMGMPHNLGCHDVGQSEDKVSVAVMEAGIIFHSICKFTYGYQARTSANPSIVIGITLVVAGDSAFGTLLVVIIFHQGFEGLALGTRISGLAPHTSLTKMKMALAGLFSLITPIGMAIGLGVMTHFNGNDKGTLIAMGTLDALSAGILVWVGVAEMLCHDWLYGDLKRASLLKTIVGMVSLMLGMVLMSVLGKWA